MAGPPEPPEQLPSRSMPARVGALRARRAGGGAVAPRAAREGTAGFVRGHPERIGPERTLRIEEVRDRARFAELAEEWNALVARTDDHFFLRHEFLDCWLEHFAGRATLRILVARNRSGRLVAALPLLQTRSVRYGIPVRQLVSTTNKHSCRYDLIAEDPPRAAEAFLAFLDRDPDWDVLRLSEVPEDGAAWELAHAAPSYHLALEKWRSARAPFVALPATLAEWEKRPRGNRKVLRRRRRRLEERGRVELLRISDPDGLDRHLSVAFKIEQSGWKGRNKTAIAQDVRTFGFYRGLAHLMAPSGAFVLCFLLLDGEPIAFQYGICHGGRFLAMKQGYREEFRAYSPGQLLMEELIRDSISRGLSTLELLGDETPAKREWSTEVRPYVWLFFFRDKFRARLLRSAKFQLGPVAREWVRRWSRMR